MRFFRAARVALHIARSLVLRLRLLDWAAIAISLSVAAVSAHVVYSTGMSDRPVVVVRAATGDFEYPLAEDRTLTFEGPIGPTVLQIQDRGVRVLSDPGPRQICVRQETIRGTGEWLACLPTGFFVRIDGRTSANRVDAGTY